MALDSDKQPWLQISLYRQTSITGIILQGREDEDQWVTSYKVQTCLDGISWNFVPGIDINDKTNEEEVSCFLLDVYDNVCLFVFVFLLFSSFFFSFYNSNIIVGFDCA